MKKSHEYSPLVEDYIKWAAEYADKSDGRMTVLPHNPDKFPAQHPDCISVSGLHADIGTINSVAIEAQPVYEKLQKDFNIHDVALARIAMAGELMQDDGNSVILSTNHGDLIDIAVAHAAVHTELVRQNYTPKTGIVISKMVSYLAYNIMDDYIPCVEVLKILEDDVFLSYPRTESAKLHLRDKIFPPEADRHNKELRKLIQHKLGEGGLLLAMAASGTTDKPINGDDSCVVMGALGHGTVDLMQTSKTYTLPVGIWYKGGHTILRAADIPRRIKTHEQADAMMLEIADTLTRATDDTEFVYTSSAQ